MCKTNFFSKTQVIENQYIIKANSILSPINTSKTIKSQISIFERKMNALLIEVSGLIKSSAYPLH